MRQVLGVQQCGSTPHSVNRIGAKDYALSGAYVRALCYLSLFFLSSCTTTQYYRSTDLSHYVSSFEDEFNVNIDYPVYFVYTDEYAGVCILPKKEVKIDYKEWVQMNVGQQEELIYHELGHCSLDKEHDNEMIVFDDGIYPKSIMHQESLSPEEGRHYIKYRQYYIDELK